MAQDAEKWDVNNPPGEYKTITINTTEGTWMNLDVSPDGNTIVFDMLGDIFTIPSTGGKAEGAALGIGLGSSTQMESRWQ